MHTWIYTNETHTLINYTQLAIGTQSRRCPTLLHMGYCAITDQYSNVLPSCEMCNALHALTPKYIHIQTYQFFSQ